MNIYFKMYEYSIESNGWNAIDVTEIIGDTIKRSGFQNGLAHVFTPEKRCMVILIEYEPNLLYDLEEFMEKYKGSPGVLEGLLGKSVVAPFIRGSLDIGIFKRIVFIDFSRSSGEKEVIISIEGSYD